MLLRRLLFANFRLVYRLHLFFRHRLTIAGRVMALFSLFSVMFSVNQYDTQAWQLSCLCISVFVVSWLLLPRRKITVEIQRKLPETVTHGILGHYHCVITNHSQKDLFNIFIIDEPFVDFPKFHDFINAEKKYKISRHNFIDRFIGWYKLIEILQQTKGGHVYPLCLNHLASGQSVGFEVKLLPLRRGYITFKQVRVARSDPLGLLRKITDIELAGSLLVLPGHFPFTIPLKTGYHCAWQEHFYSGNDQTLRNGSTEEFLSLRDYRRGDPARAIYWRGYARHRRLLTVEYESYASSPQHLCLLDNLADVSPDCFEAGLSLAVSWLYGLPANAATRLFCLDGQHYNASITPLLHYLACLQINRDISISQLATSHPHTLSTDMKKFTHAVLCIFCQWDQHRQRYLQHLANSGLSVLCYVITTTPSADQSLAMMQSQRLNLTEVHPDNIASKLSHLDHLPSL